MQIELYLNFYAKYLKRVPSNIILKKDPANTKKWGWRARKINVIFIFLESFLFQFGIEADYILWKFIKDKSLLFGHIKSGLFAKVDFNYRF